MIKKITLVKVINMAQCTALGIEIVLHSKTKKYNILHYYLIQRKSIN